jgi:hypothetical protein
MNFTKSIIQTILASIGYKLVKNSNNKQVYTKASELLERNYGHYRSKIEQKSIDANNKPVPWFTYPSIDYLSQLDLSQKIMLEWGSGNSSLFFSKRVKKLYSIEHNKEWYQTVKQHNIKNQTLELESLNYHSKPRSFNMFFDIILIDGINREECSKEAHKILKKGGMIILDNSDRHQNIAKDFRELNFIEVDFHGFGPINDYTWTTSIFFHRDFNFNPIVKQPIIPIGGGF